jgi:hypothetical protein
MYCDVSTESMSNRTDESVAACHKLPNHHTRPRDPPTNEAQASQKGGAQIAYVDA